MSMEQQIKSAIEAATAQLAAQFQERLQTLASELSSAAGAAHAGELEEAVARVTAELTSQHDTAVAALRAEAAEQRDLAVSMARSEAAEDRASALEALRGDLATEHAAALDAVRAQLVSGHEAELEALRTELTAQHEAALDALRTDLAAQHESALAEVHAAAAEQRDLAVSMARTEGAEQREAALDALRAELAAERGTALEASRTELTAQHDAALDALRAELAAQHDAALDAALAETELRHESAIAARGTELAAQHEAALEALRSELTAQHESASAELRTQLGAAHESALEAARAEADDRVGQARAEAEDLLAHARAEADQRLAAAKTEAETSLAATLAATKAETVQRDLIAARATERQAELAFVERLSDAVRRLDAARSLIEVLDVLVDAAAREVPRVAVFVVRGNKLAGWRAAGFSRDDDPRELEVPLDQAGLLTKALRSPAPVATSDAMSADAVPFGTLPVSSAAVAIPLRVGGETVGVLYADDASPREHQTPSAWPESVDVLSRHACRCLEVVTIARVTQPVSIPAPSSPTPTPSSRRHTPQVRAFSPGHDDDDDAARRYARLLVSEIKLYHESAVTAGRRDRNLLERLRTEIERARRLYGERVPAAVLARTDYFDQELVRTLANGDASLLGPA